jgi:hypothetical protein
VAVRGLILGIALLTSIVLLLAVTRGRRRWRRLGHAAVVTLETVGATVLLFAVNLAVGAVALLATRRLTPFYPSLYEVSDVALLVLSLLQALVLQAWRHARGTDRLPS